MQKDWPHVVQIDVVERQAVASARTGNGQWARISDAGLVLDVKPAATPGLPVAGAVTAPDTPGATLDPRSTGLVNVAGRMPNALRPRVAQILEENGRLSLILNTKTTVLLGDANQLDTKLMAAAAVLDNADPKTIAVLDVTSPAFPLATPVGKTTSPATTVAPKKSSASTTAATPSKTTTKPTSKPSTTAVRTTAAR